MIEKEITFDRFVRGLLFIGGIALILYGIYYMSSVLLPFFIAWVVAYMLHPVVEFFQYKLRLKNRILCIIITFLLIGGILTGLFMLAVPPLIKECVHLKDIAISYIERGTNNATIPPAIENFVKHNIDRFRVDKLLKEKDLMNVIKETLPKVWNIVYQTANLVISIVSSCITILYIFFLLMDYNKIAKGWSRFIPLKYRSFAQTLASDVAHGMNGYFRGQALVAFLVGILFSIGFLIIDFPMAIGLGMFIGLLNMVPYLQLIGFVPTILLALLKAADTGQNFWWILGGAILVFCVVQLIQDLILTPKIMGKIMGLSPALILFSLSVWGYLFGLIGLIIALPMTTLVISYYKRYVVKE